MMVGAFIRNTERLQI